MRFIVLFFITLISFKALSEPLDFMPEDKHIDGVTLTKVSASLSESDHQALLASRQFIYEIFGNSNWPNENLTPEQHKRILIKDEKWFNTGINYTYHMLNNDNEIIGCLYLTPLENEGPLINFYGFFWVTQEYQNDTFIAEFKMQIKEWLQPINNVGHVAFEMN